MEYEIGQRVALPSGGYGEVVNVWAPAGCPTLADGSPLLYVEVCADGSKRPVPHRADVLDQVAVVPPRGGVESPAGVLLDDAGFVSVLRDLSRYAAQRASDEHEPVDGVAIVSWRTVRALLDVATLHAQEITR